MTDDQLTSKFTSPFNEAFMEHLLDCKSNHGYETSPAQRVCLRLDRPSLGFPINKEGVDPIKNLDWSKTLLMFCISYIILIFFKAIKLTSRTHDEGLPHHANLQIGFNKYEWNNSHSERERERKWLYEHVANSLKLMAPNSQLSLTPGKSMPCNASPLKVHL